MAKQRNKSEHPSRRVVIRNLAASSLTLPALLSRAAEQGPATRPATEPKALAPFQLRLEANWLIAIDLQNSGRQRNWHAAIPADAGARPAPVPGIVQQLFPDFHGVAWYWTTFELATLPVENVQRALLRFGAVDYLAEVWLNGKPIGTHENGETPFEFDVSELLKSGDNFLAVRVLNPPAAAPIDGYVLAEIPHRNKTDNPTPGSGPSCGMMLPVELQYVAAVRVRDVFAIPSIENGSVKFRITFRNDLKQSANVSLQLDLTRDKHGETVARTANSTFLAPGEQVVEVSVFVSQRQLWDLDSPILYRASIETSSIVGDHDLADVTSIRFGFRDFRVIDGWFHLNGRRIYLRSSHTGNHFPVGVQVAVDPDHVRRDLIMAKAAGYNCVRFIAGLALPEQLDFCDELGLLVYQESLAAWLLGDSPKTKERFDRANREMILRDRNHPSVVIWGLLNENGWNNAFHAAVGFITELRTLDPTRLVILSSGRWDRHSDIGSVSNPPTPYWNHEWGLEHPPGTTQPSMIDHFKSKPQGGYFPDVGDVHYYPVLPQTPEEEAAFRKLGEGSKPLFLSEYGVGSLYDPVDELRAYDALPQQFPDNIDQQLVRKYAGEITEVWKRFSLDGIYPLLEDFLRDSNVNMVEQRRRSFDLIRSNPQFCGFNLTGMLDHAYVGEGPWTFWRRWKPGAAEMLQDGWAPLRWCLFTRPTHIYSGQPFEIEAVLATEDVLRPGEYPATFRIWGEEGIAWEKKTVVKIPALSAGKKYLPLAVPVLNEAVQLRLSAGKYVLAAALEKGGLPAGDRLTFYVGDAPTHDLTIPAAALDDVSKQWLARHGVKVTSFTAPTNGKGLIILGSLADQVPAVMDALHKSVDSGATLLCLSAAPFVKPATSPLGDAVVAAEFHDWLYHKEIIARRHPVFAGLPTRLLQWDYWGHALGHTIFNCKTMPDELVAASVACGHEAGTGGAVVVGVWNRGSGRIIASSLQLLETCATNPAAGRLLMNLIRYAMPVT